MPRLTAAVALLALWSGVRAAQDPLDWWKTTTVYQIYPLSFKDSNGDGIGDLRGILDKLDHVKDMGAGAIWINPFFRSPLEGYGYDITNYCDVDPVFGTIADFDELLAKAKGMDIKVILDLVPNHSSDKHEWFIKSTQRVDPYTDYYVWHDGKVNDAGQREPPNNWIATISGSAWTWSDARQQYYLHQFGVNMPDLNYRNTLVREEMKKVLRFWLDRGVDGFRVDAVPHLLEDSQFRDESLSNTPGLPPTDYGYLVHTYTANVPETYDLIREWRALLDSEYTNQDQHTRLMMTEAYATVEQTMAYYGNATHPGSHLPFNFNFIQYLNGYSKAPDYERVVHSWLDNVPAGMTSNWVAGNHDQRRVSTRFGTFMRDSINMMVTLLPGTAITYYGEEIGMVDADIGGDPSAPERTPFQWDDSTSAGFSTNTSTWLPVNTNYKELNLKLEAATDRSYYHVYQKLMEARQSPAVQRGSVNTHALGDTVFTFSRELEGADSFVVVAHVGDNPETIDLSSVYPALPDNLLVHTSNIESVYAPGSTVPKNAVYLNWKDALVLTTK
ncbi:maltase 2-like [Periplaneta americana]|uniref:maltase 2-like n=1 Tax=Periplaneta americana TaxID=6978 RepID=UPI0037E77007